MNFPRSMQRLCLAGFIALAALSGQANAADDKKLILKFVEKLQALAQGEKVNLNREISKISSVVDRYNRALLIREMATVKKQIDPDEVGFLFDMSSTGASVGDAVSNLNAKKKVLLDAAKDAGVTVKRAQVTSLSVGAGRRRSSSRPANKDEAYHGKLRIALDMQIAENPLDLIAKFTNGHVDAMSNVRFGVADPSSGAAAMKREALSKARMRAAKKAKLLGVKLGRLVNVTYREVPGRGDRNSWSELTVHASAVFERGEAIVE